ncbi:MAG: sialate O-acetylesterase [Prevotella sp.]|nr:sialate O-acetylesterase [Prevotella sp.]
MKKALVLLLALVGASMADAKVVLPQLFQSGMVMQRGKPIPVWGQADAGENVTVTFKKKTYTTTAGADGSWRIDLPQQKAGGPFQLTVNDQVIDNCLIGDVWLLSGQSNIDVTIERVYPQYGKVIDDYNNDRIRMFRVQTDTDTHGPKKDVRPTPINWKPVTKDNAWLFSAVGYFLGREMFAKTGVPQGVIVNSVGGTPIQAWLDADTLRQHFPEELQRTVFFQDDEMVRSIQRANMMAQNRWQQMLTDTDLGFADHYADRDYDDSQWTVKGAFNTVNGRQLSQNLTRDFRYTGSFWARQHITVDAAHAGQKCRLLVGTLYDADQTYVNGRQVGSTGYQYPPRRYTIPEGVLVEGDNALSVRFVTKGGAPHFIPEKPYKLIFDDGTEIALSDQWRIHEGARMPQCPGADGGGQNLPTVLYNAMLYPLAPYALTGMVWYQGESNTGGDARHYETWLTELVTGWRQLWQQPDLPFVVVQLANFMDPSDKPQDTGWSQVREAQRLVAKHQPNTELACIIDLGETVDIHPLLKQEVAQRIALGFERMLWNKKVLLSPEVVSATVEGNTVTLTLDQPLRDNGQLFEFELAGADGRFQNAEATGQGNIITVTSPVAAPVRLRYAWKNNPLRANVFGTTGLPMAPMEMGL